MVKKILLPIIIIGIILFIVFYIFNAEEYLSKDTDVTDIKQKLLPFFPELRSVKLMRGEKSYTLGKYRIFVCTRDKKTNQLYDDNTLTHVILHELAHTICRERGHTGSFFEIFDGLLTRATDMGLFDPDKNIKEDYCS